MYRVIVHESFKNQELFSILAPSLHIVRFAASIKADIIFLDAQPSLGCLVFPSSCSVANMVESIAQLQNTFTHSFVVVSGELSNDKLTAIQLAIPCGTGRFYVALTTQAAAHTTLMHVKLMTDKTKLDLQKQYFAGESLNVVSAASALNVLREAHGHMGISPHDTSLIATSYPSLSRVMGADHARLHYQVPCDERVAQVLDNFFSARVRASGDGEQGSGDCGGGDPAAAVSSIAGACPTGWDDAADGEEGRGTGSNSYGRKRHKLCR